MAPFNTNQVKYIQAVAGRQQHTTLKAIYQNGTIKSNEWEDYHAPQTFDVTSPLLLAQFPLHTNATAWDCRGVHNNDLLEGADFDDLPNDDVGFGKFIGELRSLDVPIVNENFGTHRVRADDEFISSTLRATPDGFLKSLNLKLRLTLPTNIPVAHPVFADIKKILDEGAADGSSDISAANYSEFWNGQTLSGSKSQSIRAALDVYARSHPMHTPHYEFRLIMFRNRLPTYRKSAGNNSLDAIRNGVSLLNPGYDLFMGQTGRPRGPLGYRTSPNLDKNMDPNGSPAPYYSGKRIDWSQASHPWVNGSIPSASGDAGHGDTTGSNLYPLGENAFTHRDLMTMPLNKNDYVVMRDVRFFLGQAQGKSHYEDVFDFDFNDPINTADTDLCSSDTLSDKNYRWKCVIIGTSNGKDPVHLNYEIRGTTCVQSG
jgi:hypothetical protein